MKKLNSSHIDMIHYEPSTKTLHVIFHNGQQYHYHGVPEHEYKSFENAHSHGKHFIMHIKNKYAHRKI